MYQTSDIRKGLKIERDDAPWTITYFQFVKPGKGCAFTRTKQKNLLTGRVVDITYKTGEKIAPADISEHTMQYLYNDGELYHFMNTENFEQVGIPGEVLGKDVTDFLLEEAECQVLFYKGRPVNADLPNFVDLKITYCEPGVKGNTAQGTSKPATLETGAEVQVPLFINEGETIRIDTRTGDYVGRSSE
ncbi:MAG: elongation factor P [Deltaproteobacteria bacterium]|nr:MAG: elongation factor P [Deltaproteobacteria bacterium]